MADYEIFLKFMYLGDSSDTGHDNLFKCDIYDCSILYPEAIIQRQLV